MELFKEQERVCTDCFENNPNFKFLLNKAFEEEINIDTPVNSLESSSSRCRSCWPK